MTLDDLGDWERVGLPQLTNLEDTWHHPIDGTTLLHFGLRTDNCEVGYLVDVGLGRILTVTKPRTTAYTPITHGVGSRGCAIASIILARFSVGICVGRCVGLLFGLVG